MGKKLVEVEYLKNGKSIIETYKTIDDADREKLATIIKENEIISMHSKEATLEEIFITVTGRGLI